MTVKFKEKTPTAKNIYTFKFEAKPRPPQIAGQFLTITIPHENADDRGNRRWFTCSASPTEEDLAITTKFNTERSSSFKTALFNLEPGTELEIIEPKGDFVLPEDTKLPLVFVAGGIGVTPYRSIIKFLADTNQTRTIQLIYSVSDEAELAFRDLFDSLDWLKKDYLVGEKLTAEKVKGIAGGFEGKLVYLSGPEPMVEALNDQLKANGLPEEQIKTDFFPGYAEI